MKKFLSFFVLFLVLNSCSNAIVFDQQEIRKQITLEETEFILQTLASDQMKGRDSDSGGYFKAADFVINYFKENGVLPFYPNYQDSLITQNVVSYNVVGQIWEYNPKRKTVLIGAHLDHVGIKEIEVRTWSPNHLQDLKTIAKLENLTRLNLQQNSIRTNDLAPLNTLSHLG